MSSSKAYGPAPVRVAVMGVRHGHIYAVLNAAKAREDVVLAAVCEEDDDTRAALVASGVWEQPYGDYRRMLDEIECDAIAIGDYYARRGAIAIEALRCGKHVISDKPLCTRLDELDVIAMLARDKRLSIGCQFDMRYSGHYRALRRLVRGGEIGEVHAVGFNGQHPLMFGTRFGWYFEAGKHCGTINDIAIHACDYLPWVTGLQFIAVNAARNWTTRPDRWPHFRDAAQLMLTMTNGCGVLGDVSYLAPDSFKYTLPQYHRTTLWGSEGMVEVGYNLPDLLLYRDGESEPRAITPDPDLEGGPFDAFLHEMRGSANPELTTDEVLRASRVALVAQQAADDGLTNLAI